MNRHFETIANLLDGMNNTFKKSREAMAENREKLQQYYAQQANNEIMKKLLTAAFETQEKIEKERDAALQDLEKDAELSGAAITADVKLLDFDLSPEQFAALAKKYKNNPTMSLLLLKYAEKNGAGFMDGWSFTGANENKKPFYDVTLLYSADKKRQQIESLAASAIDICKVLGTGADSSYAENLYGANPIPFSSGDWLQLRIDTFKEKIKEIV